MDLSSTQHSPSIINLYATICSRKKAENTTILQGLRCANRHSNSADWLIIPTVPVLPSFVIFDLVLLKFCFIEGPYTIRFFKIHIDS